MQIEQIYTGCLAEAAYYIESEGEAVIIDPLRETKPYLEKLEKEGAKLKYIFETHFHADFVSGHVDLSQKTGAPIVYGPTASPKFDFYSATDGEELKVGKVTFKVLHTPGHTPESTTFLLFDENGVEYAIFTGDTLFIGDVGRPDLAQKATNLTQEDLAGQLFDSLRKSIMPLPDHIIVYPAHGAGSACGKNMSEKTWDTLGHQMNTNYALREDMTREEFIDEVLEGLTLPPVYFAQNVKLNKEGYDSIDQVLDSGVRALSPNEFESIAQSTGAIIIDTRSKEDFAKAHIPGSIFIGLDGSFAPWVGTLVPDIKQELLLIVDGGKEEEVVTRLARVGYDRAMGYLDGGMESWINQGMETDHIKSLSAEEFALMYSGESHILDVRRPSEYLVERVEASKNIPLNYINEHMEEIERSSKYYLYCRTGYRSLIAVSILKARGFNHLVDLSGGIESMKHTSIPMVTDVCPSTLKATMTK